jgi:acyl carrier protein
MTDGEIYGRLQKLFDTVFGRTDIALTPELTPEAVPGWDSFRHVDFIMATEEQFGINLRDADLDEMQSIGDLARIIGEKVDRPQI